MRTRRIACEELGRQPLRGRAVASREQRLDAQYLRLGAQRARMERAIVTIELGQRARCIAASERRACVVERAQLLRERALRGSRGR